MIKKILLITLMLMVCTGCMSKEARLTKKLTETGYSESEIQEILTLDESLGEVLKKEYNPRLLKLSLRDDFVIENLDTYLAHLDYEDDLLVYLTNSGFIDEEILDDLFKDKFYIQENLDKYIKYQDEFEDIRSLVEYVNAKAYLKPYEEYQVSDVSKDILMNASKLYTIQDFVPEDLEDLGEEYAIGVNGQLRKEAKEAFIKMCEDARKEDAWFYASSAYRAYEFQVYLYEKYLKIDPQEVVDTYSSRPGFSDHQTGLTCDIIKDGGDFDTFYNTKECNWLKDNAYKYGFIMRYPEGKDDITKYEYEWWHYRYVGTDAAKIIYENGITFDEYYEFYVNR